MPLPDAGDAVSWDLVYPADPAGARRALAHSLAGGSGFESSAQEDGSLYTLGRAVFIRPGPTGFEVVFGPGGSKFERIAVAVREGLGQEKSSPGDVVRTVLYTRESLGVAAWYALDYAHKGERSEYAEFAPPGPPRTVQSIFSEDGRSLLICPDCHHVAHGPGRCGAVPEQCLCQTGVTW